MQAQLLESESAMVKKLRRTRTPRLSSAAKEVLNATKAVDREEKILREATKHLVYEHGMFLVATGLRETRVKGLRVWIITVTLRYTTAHEGYIGDLLYDGENFTFLTPTEVRKDRARQIAADPERLRKGNEYGASTRPQGEG